MKITISCSGGTARSIHLARQLDQRGLLHKLYVPFLSRKHPYVTKLFDWEDNEQSIDLDKVYTNLKFTVLSRLINKVVTDRFLLSHTIFHLREAIDKYVSSQLDNGSDIVVAEANMALRSIKRAKELGALTVLDRTNSHIEYQTELMRDEYVELGLDYIWNSLKNVQKGSEEYQEVDYICVPSSFVKRTFLERDIPERKLLHVPPGVDLNTFKQINKENSIFRIICCGSSSVKKGTHYLLQAFRELKLKNAELWFIGGIFGDIKPLLKTYEDCYKKIGYVRHSELYKYFSQGSVFVLPSLEEGFAKVILEAMACGLPVIATTNTGAEDVLGDGIDGFVIPIRSVEAIKEKILFMYEHQDVCREMGKNAKERVKQGFTWEDYADRMVDVYKRVLQQKERIVQSSSAYNASYVDTLKSKVLDGRQT